MKTNYLNILKKSIVFGLVLSTLTGCSQTTQATEITQTSESAETNDNTSGNYLFSDYEKSVYDSNAQLIDSANISSGYTITNGGFYKVTGEIENGYIKIDTKENVHLFLDNVSYTGNTGPFINIINSKEAVITLIGENSITVSGENSDGESSAIFSKDTLTINGSGTLSVISEDDGIHVNDTLKLFETTVSISAESDGIEINDGLFEQNSAINITAEKDGINADGDKNDDNQIYLNGGTVNITASDDGISSTIKLITEDTELTINAGNFEKTEIQTGNGINNMTEGMMNPREGFGMQNRTEERTGMEGAGQENFGENFEEGRKRPGMNGMREDMRKPGESMESFQDSGMMTPPQNGEMHFPDEMTQNTANTEETDDSSTKSKGISSEAEIIIKSGNINITSQDDAINTTSVVTVNDGDITINSGDDAIHSDEDILIFGGNINIEYSHEGLEGKNIAIDDGTINIYSADDGINVADGEGQSKFEADSSYLLITGGTIVINSYGDGIDINGNGKMSGGNVTVYGPENSGNAAIDYNGEFLVEGGTIVAAGMSGMAQAPKSETLEVISLNIEKDFSIEGTSVDFSSDKKFNNVIVVSEEIRKGQKYSVVEK